MIIEEEDSLAEAEATLTAAIAGSTVQISLGKPLGAKINPDATVGSTSEGGQFSSIGLRAGCRILSVGGSSVASLDDVKIALKAAKSLSGTDGASACQITFVDAKLQARARARVAHCRAAAQLEKQELRNQTARADRDA